MKAFYSTVLAALFGALVTVSANGETERSIFPGHVPARAITVGTGGKYPNLTVALNDTSRCVVEHINV